MKHNTSYWRKYKRCKNKILQEASAYCKNGNKGYVIESLNWFKLGLRKYSRYFCYYSKQWADCSGNIIPYKFTFSDIFNRIQTSQPKIPPFKSGWITTWWTIIKMFVCNYEMICQKRFSCPLLFGEIIPLKNHKKRIKRC